MTKEESGAAEAKSTKPTKRARAAKQSAQGAPKKEKAPAKPKREPKPKAAKAAKTPRSAKVSKGDKLVELLQRKGGATLKELEKASGWQSHTVRGFLSGVVRKKLGLTVTSSKEDGGERSYFVEG